MGGSLAHTTPRLPLDGGVGGRVGQPPRPLPAYPAVRMLMMLALETP